jgi:hypothetical protein
MNQQEATEFVIRELGKHRQKNDIIQKLCEATGMDWPQAEKFMHQVRTQHGGQIARSQSPLITVMSIGFILVGLALSVFILYETLNGLIIFFLRLPIPYLGNITYFLVGVGMIAGGIRGMWDTIVQMWNG